MLEKRTVVSQIEITYVGTVQVKLEKQVVEDGKVLAFEYHRMVIEPDVPAADTMAGVNRHLEAMNCRPLDAAEFGRIKGVADVVHTPAVVAAFASLRAADKAVRDAQNEGARRQAEAAAEAKHRDLVETVRRGA